MSIHIGEKIKQRAKQLRIGPTELSKMVNTSKQNIYGIYKRKSIDSDLLKKISKALDYNFFEYYIADELVGVSEPKVAYNDSKDKLIRKLSLEIEELKKQLSDKEIAYLKKINEILEKKGK